MKNEKRVMMSHHPGLWDTFLVWVQSHAVISLVGPCVSMV
jgi:hypothetical protein